MSLKWFSPDGDRQAFFSGADALLLPLVPLDDQLVVETQPPLVTRVLLYFDNDGSRCARLLLLDTRRTHALMPGGSVPCPAQACEHHLADTGAATRRAVRD